MFFMRKDDYEFRIDELCHLMDGKKVGLPLSRHVTGFSIDTRTLKQGALFIPLPGRNSDGHEFIADAFAKGASASLCSFKRRPCLEGNPDFPLILVEEPLRAVQTIALFHRSRFQGPVVAVSGSNGKTTTKDWLAMLLECDGPVHSTEGTRNNHIGLPLTLLGIRPYHQAAVVEIGVSYTGEMNMLANLSRPDVAVLTNVGAAHLEGFGGIKEVALEKGLLLNHLAKGGTAVLNFDDPFCRKMGQAVNSSLISFGTAEDVTLRASGIRYGDTWVRFFLDFRGNRCGEVCLHGPGRFNVYNFLAAASGALAAGGSVDHAISQAGLLSQPPNRWQEMLIRGITLINDAYNANPDSMRASLEAYQRMLSHGKRYFVCGTMMELGEEASNAHRILGIEAAECGVDHLLAVGEFAPLVVRGFRQAAPSLPAAACRTREEAATILNSHLRSGDAVLLKGSRAAEMEKLISLLS